MSGCCNNNIQVVEGLCNKRMREFIWTSKHIEVAWDDLLNKFGMFLKYFFYLHYYSLSLSIIFPRHRQLKLFERKKEEEEIIRKVSVPWTFYTLLVLTNEFHTNKVVVIIFYWLHYGFVWSLDTFMVDTAKITWRESSFFFSFFFFL